MEDIKEEMKKARKLQKEEIIDKLEDISEKEQKNSEDSYDPDELKKEAKQIKEMKKERKLQKEEFIDKMEDCDISDEEKNKKGILIFMIKINKR